MNAKMVKWCGLFFAGALLVIISCKKSSKTSETVTVPPAVTTDSVIYQHSGYALCKGAITDTGTGKTLRFGFCWSKSHQPVADGATSYTVNGGLLLNNRFSATIGPLDYGSTYYVRAFASNYAGFGYGAEMRIETDSIPIVVSDGVYIKGAVTAYPDFNHNALMAVALNEVTQTPRAQLMELYLPIKAGAAGFNIVQVTGSVKTTYGPGSGFGVVTTPTVDEPKVPFQRGPATTTNPGVFTVPADGFYHVVIDLGLKKVAIMRVHWGMIGVATPGGWSNDTLMTESAYSITTMSWTLPGLTLLQGEWKLRYSRGWKVEIDTNLVVGGGQGCYR